MTATLAGLTLGGKQVSTRPMFFISCWNSLHFSVTFIREQGGREGGAHVSFGEGAFPVADLMQVLFTNNQFRRGDCCPHAPAWRVRMEPNFLVPNIDPSFQQVKHQVNTRIT